MDKRAFKLSEVVVVIVITALLSALVTGFVSYHTLKTMDKVSYINLSSDKDLREFLEVYSELVSDYYEDLDRGEMLDSAITAMMSYLDETYSTHLTEADTDALMDNLVGEYEGIGISVGSNLTIMEVFKDSPAEKAGLKANDVVIKLDGTDVTKKSSSELASMIKGNSNKTINITVMRNKEEIEFEVTRSNINIPSVYSEIVEKTNIGYMYITTFSNTTYDQFSKQLSELEKNGINSLIIDLRNNSGGYLISAKQISSLFLENGKVIYSLEDKSGKTSYKDETKEHREYPIVVIVNGSSASAAEILAAALHDSYGAAIVGHKSYGKGKVQQTKSLKNGSMIKYTSAKWLRPNGECVDGIGIEPDYAAELEIDGNSIIDAQYNKAIELLK